MNWWVVAFFLFVGFLYYSVWYQYYNESKRDEKDKKYRGMAIAALAPGSNPYPPAGIRKPAPPPNPPDPPRYRAATRPAPQPKRKEKNDDNDGDNLGAIVAGVLLGEALSGTRTSEATERPNDSDSGFAGNGGSFAGAGASASWDSDGGTAATPDFSNVESGSSFNSDA